MIAIECTEEAWAVACLDSGSGSWTRLRQARFLPAL